MTDITPYDAIPDTIVPGTPTRPRVLLIGTCLVCAAIVMGYAGLLGFYVSQRAAVISAGEVWLPEGTVIPLTQPNFMMFTLVWSVVSVMWALHAVKRNDQANALIAFGLTLLFGFAQLVQTGFLLTLMELVASESERAVLIYALIGVQLGIMAAAMGFVFVMALRTLGGDYSDRDYEGVLSATVFWCMSVGIYAALWYAVYITK